MALYNSKPRLSAQDCRIQKANQPCPPPPQQSQGISDSNTAYRLPDLWTPVLKSLPASTETYKHAIRPGASLVLFFKVGTRHCQQVSSGFVEVLTGRYVDKNSSRSFFFFFKGEDESLLNKCSLVEVICEHWPMERENKSMLGIEKVGNCSLHVYARCPTRQPSQLCIFKWHHFFLHRLRDSTLHIVLKSTQLTKKWSYS